NPFQCLNCLISVTDKTKAFDHLQKPTGHQYRGNKMTEHLLRKAKKGDPDAFCSLMDTQTQSMYKIARTYLKNDDDASDAVQYTILSCYENLLSLKNKRYVKPLLNWIIIKKCRDILRRKKRMLCTDTIPETVIYEEYYETAEWNQVLAPLN